jgi:aminoglycoside N3'-acetyltransferase
MQKISKKEIDIAFKKLNFKRNSCVVIHSSLIHLGLIEGVNLKKMPEEIYSLIKKNLGKNATICVPSSNWDYSDKKKPFDKIRSNSHKEFGALSNYIVNKKNSFRSNNPLFNITALGKKAKYITNGGTSNAFGVDSAWDKLYNLDAEIILLGCDFSEATFTFTRYIEFRFGVPYLYNKLFNLPIFHKRKKIFKTSTSTLRYLDLDLVYDLKKFKNVLKKKKILFEGRDKKIKITKVRMKPCFDLGIECLKKDIYFFLKKKPKFKKQKFPLK